MAKTNSRLMKLFWLIEDGAGSDAIMEFLSRTGRADFQRRPPNERQQNSQRHQRKEEYPKPQEEQYDDEVPF